MTWLGLLSEMLLAHCVLDDKRKNKPCISRYQTHILNEIIQQLPYQNSFDLRYLTTVAVRKKCLLPEDDHLIDSTYHEISELLLEIGAIAESDAENYMLTAKGEKLKNTGDIERYLKYKLSERESRHRHIHPKPLAASLIQNELPEYE